MSREEICFIYNGEIYYRLGATDKQIDYSLKHMVEQGMYFDDYEHGPEISVQAQISLIFRQADKIIDKHCK